MSFRHPFQKLCPIQSLQGAPKILLGATGSQICSFSISDGLLMSVWPSGITEDKSPDPEAANLSGSAEEENGEPPAKRQRVHDDRQSSEDSIEIVSERVKGQRRKTKVVNTKLPYISHLLSTRDGRHVVAVTTDDKCIRVFEVSKAGRLCILSERCMPKRLCAITLTSDQGTIIAGDKFGDVYSLPLFKSEEMSKALSPKHLVSPPPDHTFKPSATELTVHTAGNLEALRQQREQKQIKPRKEGPTFEHKLLLGHVSLLTDVAIAEIPTGDRMRHYILTADRDEHIRVSRGIPQAHIIEHYCSGHKEFVSKICILPWKQSMLVAGSGEPSLKVFLWPEERLLDDSPFGDIVRAGVSGMFPSLASEGEKLVERFTVSGIWAIELVAGEYSDAPEVTGVVLVALEGLSILLSYLISDDGKLNYHQTLHLPGNALDVTLSRALDEANITALISVDTVHLPGSCKEYRPRGSEQCPFYLSFTISDGSKWERSNLAERLNKAITATDSATTTYEPPSTRPEKAKPAHHRRASAHYSALGEFLYGLENLRKKRGADAIEEEQEQEQEHEQGLEGEGENSAQAG